MNFTRFLDTPVIDCHVHHRLTSLTYPQFIKHAQTLTETINTGHLQYMYTFGKNNHASLYLKAKHPNHYYSGGYAPWTGETKQFGNKNWKKYIEHLIKLGYDGIGETGSKPVTRDKHTPLDSKYYKGFWETCEEYRFPILCHIGDVEAFWKEETTPQWAKDRDWGYYQGNYPTFQELYHEIFNVLN